MGEVGITVGLIIAIMGLGWLVYRVVSTLAAGGQTSSLADINAIGASPGSERIDSEVDRIRSEAVIRHRHGGGV